MSAVSYAMAADSAPAEAPVQETNTAPDNPAGAPPSEGRPEWLPEKFNSPEELAKSYTELEKKLSGGGSPPPAEYQVQDAEAKITETLETNGLDFAKYQQSYVQNGGLTEQDYAELAKAGLSREFINDYIAGQEAIAEQHKQRIFNDIGGEEQFNKLTAWAKQNLSQQEVQAFNTIIETQPMEAIHMAVLGLQARYQAANGRAPNLYRGEGGASNIQGFQSRAEMVRAMQDTRYKTDPAYRSQVEQRVFASNL